MTTSPRLPPGASGKAYYKAYRLSIMLLRARPITRPIRVAGRTGGLTCC